MTLFNYEIIILPMRSNLENLQRTKWTRLGTQKTKANFNQKRISRTNYQQRDREVYQKQNRQRATAGKTIFRTATVEKQKKYIVLPYNNNKVDAFSSKLTKLVNNTFDVELRVAFKSPKEIGHLFSFNDNIKDKHAQSLVINKITCETCKQSYIGKTKRILIHRISHRIGLCI